MNHEELVARQTLRRQDRFHLPFCAVLNNIRSLYNVGSIFRTADGAGLEKLWLCGITGIPPDPKISKTALDAQEAVAWEFRASAASLLTELKSSGYQIVLLEQMTGSVPYQEFKPEDRLCLVVGNEITGVSEEITGLCDASVEVGMHGLKNSLNVAVAFGIVAYHFRHGLAAKS